MTALLAAVAIAGALWGALAPLAWCVWGTPAIQRPRLDVSNGRSLLRQNYQHEITRTQEP